MILTKCITLMVAPMIATVICLNESLLYHLITFVLP